MTNHREIQRTGGRRQQSSLPAVPSTPPFDPELLRLRLNYFGLTAVPSTILLTAMTGGQFGESALVAALLGGAAGYFGPNLHRKIEPGLRVALQAVAYLGRNNSGRARHRLLDKHWWLTGEVGVLYAPASKNVVDTEPLGTIASKSDEETDEDMQEASPVVQPSAPGIPAQFTLGRGSLTAIKEANQKRQVYFGRTATRQVVLDIDDMYHVLDVAKSGRGKSNRFRHAMMQLVSLADTYYINPFAAPVKSVSDSRKIEVWQPIYDRLANKRPVRERDEILELLTRLVDEIATRSDQEQEWDFSWRAHPIFVFIDEVPEIYARCPEAVALLDRIGRGGRQFGIFAWIATQTLLVKDIGLSTASQAQFKTLIYGGGDKTSGNRVMGYVSPEQEKALKIYGAGLTLMIADGLDDAEYVRAPLLTNEALFEFLGLPPFQIEEWLTRKNKQPGSQQEPPAFPGSGSREAALAYIIGLLEGGKVTEQGMIALLNQLPAIYHDEDLEKEDEEETSDQSDLETEDEPAAELPDRARVLEIWYTKSKELGEEPSLALIYDELKLAGAKMSRSAVYRLLSKLADEQLIVWTKRKEK